MMSESPIHVHVQDNTPVHVHVKKPKGGIMRAEKPFVSSTPNVRRSLKPSAKSRSKAINGPWIPAPGKTSLREKIDPSFKWDSGKSQLEINVPTSELKMADLSGEEEERVRSHIKNYEKKIEELMNEVGSLRNEGVNIRRTMEAHERNKFLKMEFSEGIKKQAGEDVNVYQLDVDGHAYKSKCYVKKHRLVLFNTEKPTALNKKSGKQWYEDMSDDEEKKREKIYHVRCHKPPNTMTEFDRRLIKAVKKIEDKAPGKNALKFENTEPEMTKKDETLFFDSSYRRDFENQGVEKVSKHSSVQEITPRKATDSKQVELKKIEHELEDRDEQLEASRAALEDQRKELDSFAREYDEAERENTRLRKSVERIKEEFNSSTTNNGDLLTSKDALLKKLVEVELDGASCAKQVAALRETISRLRHEKRISESDQALVTRERELLMQKMEDFESSNRSLRRLLQAHHELASDVKRLEEHRDTMIKKVADSDSTVLKLKSELAYTKTEFDQVLSQLQEEKNHTRTLTELNKSVDATRAHLQRELRAKEMENNRLHVQLRNIEKDSNAAIREAEEATASARLMQETIVEEKEALKKATRAQRQRADKSDQICRELDSKLSEKDAQLVNMKEESDTWKSRYHRAMDDRARADTQVKSLSNKLDELESMLRRNENKFRDREAELTEKLHKFTTENNSNQLECERMKGELKTALEKLRAAQEDAAAQRAQAQQYEGLNSELRAQIAKCKNEAEEALLSAERAEREARRMREQGSDEIERVRKQMLQRMKDLQPLPEILKETEMKLQDAQDQLLLHERRSAEQTKIISELSSKAECQEGDTETLRQRLSALKDENRALEARLDIVHTKLNDRDNVLRESAVQKADKDENIQTLQLKLEEKTHMCNSLQRQLDAALEEVRKTGEMERDKGTARERAAQSRIADLETQVTRAKTGIASIKREKVDSERKAQSQLQDARDRLEQSESTNRSMRNYVQFLKSSYNNVFGTDTSLTSTPIRGGTTSPRSPY